MLLGRRLSGGRPFTRRWQNCLEPTVGCALGPASAAGASLLPSTQEVPPCLLHSPPLPALGQSPRKACLLLSEENFGSNKELFCNWPFPAGKILTGKGGLLCDGLRLPPCCAVPRAAVKPEQGGGEQEVHTGGLAEHLLLQSFTATVSLSSPGLFFLNQYLLTHYVVIAIYS